MLHNAEVVLWALSLTLTLPLLALAFYTAYWMSYAWHSPAHYDNATFVNTRDSTAHTFSIIVPVRDEPYPLIAATVGCALAQTHPSVEVVIAVGYDDPQTLTAARRIADEHPGRVTVAVNHSDVHNKPTHLNAALPECTGEIVGILDAESQAATDLIAQVDAAFQDSGVTIVQGGVVLVNFQDSWIALRACLEYYLHHRSKAHYSAKRNALLMGGNTVFFRRELLEELGGWDAGNLAEDAEVGIRAAALGHGVRIAYDPHLVTREEAATTVGPWIRQRTRWNLGFLQTLSKGVWRQLPDPAQRRFALWGLLQPSMMALAGIALPIAVLTVLTSPPLWLAMLTFTPLLPTLMVVALECAALRAWGKEMGFPLTETAQVDGAPASRMVKIRSRDYLKLVASTPLYQVLLAYAAVRAVVLYTRGDFRWDKTTHHGAHLTISRVSA